MSVLHVFPLSTLIHPFSLPLAAMRDEEVFALLGGAVVWIVIITVITKLVRKARAGSTAAGSSFAITDTAMQSLVIPRTDANSYTRAVLLQDQIYNTILAGCAAAKVQQVGYKSPALHPEVWVKVELVLPQPAPDLSLRSSIHVTIERLDFHRFEHLMKVELLFAGGRHTIPGVIELRRQDVDAIIRFLAGLGGARPPKLRRVRTWLDFWRPLNKLTRVRPDYLLLFLILFSIILFFSLYGIPVAVLIWIGIYLWQRKRHTYVLTTGKPKLDPRHLIRLDSWQVNIRKIGSLADDFRLALMDRLRASAGPEILIEAERIWYPGVDGKVERTQIVTTFRRAIGFIHINTYGDDLYVGWDTHVNAATWIEQRIASGIDRTTGRPVVANRAVAGWQAPNEYDLTDGSFLTEWLHATIVRLIRLKMEEHQIDQEIDFTIQRESRRGVLNTADPAAEKKEKAGGGFGSKLKRVG